MTKTISFNMSNKLHQFYLEAKGNKWYRYFAIFCRYSLALAWGISGFVKISGERFAAGLSSNHPLGQYFDALLDTGYYYTFLGVSQVIVAALLIIPRTSLLGALSSFPIIVNICVLTYSVRFEGTRATTFMLLANLFLLVWDYDRLKVLLPLKENKVQANLTSPIQAKNNFPYLFFGGVISTLAVVVILNQIMYDIRPGNEPAECYNSCPGNSDPAACMQFCECIHQNGTPLNECLENYERAKDLNKLSSTSPESTQKLLNP